jgi:hypothetical protein
MPAPYSRVRHCPDSASRAQRVLYPNVTTQAEATVMGKYLIAWILGVPAFVLVIIYLLFN